MRVKINYQLKRLVLKEVKKNPYLGVRAIAKVLREKSQIDISKSAVASIIKSKGIVQKKGPKEYCLVYKRKEIKDCGLFLLKAIDSRLGLFDILIEELRPYFPRLDARWLKRLLLLVSFSSYVGGSVRENVKKQGFLRLADCYFYPAHKINYFLTRVSNYKPVVSLEKAKENARMVSTIKFYFADNQLGYCDAKMTTFWDGPCKVKEFFSTLYHVSLRLSSMHKDKLILVNYTKSFDYLSPLVLNFIFGVSSGIKKIEFLDAAGKVLESRDYGSVKSSFFVGYYPKILSRGLSFLEKEKRFRKLNNLEVFYTTVLTRFSQLEGSKGLILNNILIKTKDKVLPSWGILSDRRSSLDQFIQKYLLLWPYMEKTLLEDMKVIESFFFSKQEKNDLANFIPDTISFEKEDDFAKIAHILFSVFKQEFGAVQLEEKSGNLAITKHSCNLLLKNISPQIKKVFNNACLYLENKRAFIV